VVAHDEYLAITLPHCSQIKPKSLTVKRSRARFLIVLKWEPEPLKLPNLFSISVPLEIDDVGDAQLL
jgi:hypothetical protein